MTIRNIAIALALLVALPAMAQADIKVVVIPLSGDDIKGLNFTGPQVNLPQKMAEAAGFSVCHSETFQSNGTLISDILTSCNKPELMLACRPVGDTVFQLAAHAPRADVMFDTGNSRDVTNTANGSEWYYSDARGWGFAPVGSTVYRTYCDVVESGVTATNPVGPTTDFRMCQETGSSTIIQGWRCGAIYQLSTTYERVFLHR